MSCVIGLFSGKNLYNNEHVAIKLVSLCNSLPIALTDIAQGLF